VLLEQTPNEGEISLLKSTSNSLRTQLMKEGKLLRHFTKYVAAINNFVAKQKANTSELKKK